MLKLIRRWLDRSTPQERATLERRRTHWTAVASDVAQKLIRSAESNRYGKSELVYVDRLKHFTDQSVSFIHGLVKEEIKKSLGSFDLRHFSVDANNYMIGFHLAITDKVVSERLRTLRTAL